MLIMYPEMISVIGSGSMFEFMKTKKTVEVNGDPELAEKRFREANEQMENEEEKKAERLYHEAVEIFSVLYDEDKERYRKEYTKCCMAFGECLFGLEKYTEAFEVFELADRLFIGFPDVDSTPVREKRAENYCNIGDSCFFRGKYEDALRNYDNALDIYEKLSNEFPEKYLSDIAYCYDCMAKGKSGLEDFPAAVEYYNRVIEICADLAAASDQEKGDGAEENRRSCYEDLAVAYSDIGYTYSCMSDLEETERYYLMAADIFKKLAVEDRDDYIDFLMNQYADLSALYADMDRPDLKKQYSELSKKRDI